MASDLDSENAGEGNSSAPKRILGRIVGFAIVLGAVALSVWVYHDLSVRPRTDDAYVRANTVGIAPHVSGPIVELSIVDNQPVSEGQVLFVVDPRPYQAAVEKAQADLLMTDLEIEGMEGAVRAAESEVERRKAEAEYAVQYLERVRPLLEKKFVTANQVFEAESQASAALSAMERARFELDQATKELGEVDGINARRKSAEAKLIEAELNLGYCEVRAPFDGYVTNLNIAVGEYANRGEQVFALVDNREWYVMANFREVFLENIKPGMRVEVYLMSYPGRPFEGEVQGIGWALWQRNGSTVGVLPDVEPSLNWVRLAQRFPVRIVLEKPDPDYPYRMGSTAVVTIKGFPDALSASR
ncbi:MAG: biotin/lipoyl-binding protein [Myxococcota bacterium]|nr:biotin/lipoyl-binding protein [Myxococcota bacterium]